MQSRKILPVLFVLLLAVTAQAQNWPATAKTDTLRDENGKILRIENPDNFEHLDFEYNAENQLTRTTFTTRKNGTQYEKITDYFAGGAVWRESFFYIRDKKFYGKQQQDSSCTEYYESGRIREKRFYAKGKDNGQRTQYYENGNIENELSYTNGKLMAVKSYNAHGAVLDNGEFKDGNGKVTVYCAGIPIGICTYKNGKLRKGSCTYN